MALPLHPIYAPKGPNYTYQYPKFHSTSEQSRNDWLCKPAPEDQKAETIERFVNKAGSGNRTRINSLEGYGFTTKLCPHPGGAWLA